MIAIYLDSSVIIYLVQGQTAFQRQVETAIQQADMRGARYLVSDLGRLECRVGPLRAGNPGALASFDAFFAHPSVHRLALNTAVFDRATRIRADHGLQVADAIHLATAVEHGCEDFWTGDQRLARVAGALITVSLFAGATSNP